MIELTPLLFLYAAIVMGAVVMAAFAPERDRAAAYVCSAALVASWMVCLLSFTPYSAEQFLTGKHDLATHASAFAVMDTISAVTVFVMARYRWWGQVLFGLLFCGVANDAVLWLGAYNWLTFSHMADALFIAEEAIFFALGGGKIADLVSRHARFHGLRLVRSEN